ncbi:hypothetical protein FBPa1_0036 [Pseudomonas phage vB_PaeP_FBPa1]|nr:hypothetical protein FBPa1_0036 [Pseudomonas phage vB_PaeP_FBPa1]
MKHYAFCKVGDVWKYKEYEYLHTLVTTAQRLPDGSLICCRFKLTGVRWWNVGMTNKGAIEDTNLLPEDLRAMLMIWGLDQLLE